MLPRMQAPPCVRGRAAGARRTRPTLARNRLLGLLVVVLSLVAVCCATSAGAGTPHSSSGARGITRLHGLEPQLLAAINDLRHAQGLRPLRLSRALTVAAD